MSRSNAHPSSPDDRSLLVKPRRSRLVSALSWPIALVLLGASLAWTISGMSWIADLLANLAAQWLVITLPFLFVWLVLRRWGLVLVALIACVNHGALLSIGRAAFWPKDAATVRPTDPHEVAPDSSGVVRFFHFNASPNATGDEIERIMSADGADVISILGPDVPEQARVIYGHHLEDLYAGKLKREWIPGHDGPASDVSACFVVSRWPLERWNTAGLGPIGKYILAGVVDRPGGAFGLIAVHPRSPRSAGRWALGNMVVDATIVTAAAMRARGLPVVVLADLNSTPTGSRSRHLYWAGDLRRAKPLFDLVGTYPFQVSLEPTIWIPGRSAENADSPGSFFRRFRHVWPASVAIDDALVSSEIEVVGWRLLGKLSPEHRPVLVDLRIPWPGTREANAESR